MENPVQVRDDAQAAMFCAVAGAPPLSPEESSFRDADAHWMVAEGDGSVSARCSLWWTSTPRYPGHRIGFIGHYAAASAEHAATLLDAGCLELRSHGCTLAVGPLDGNTWRRYRLITERGTEPPFFLEPDNPDSWPLHFADRGFRPFAHYFSALNPDLTRGDPTLAEREATLQNKGFRARALDPGRFDDDLRFIFEISLESFPQNLLYAPISEREFFEMYRPLREHIDPDLVVIAERGGVPAGFMVGVPDLLRGKRGQPIDTVILKTMAVMPDCMGAGLGSFLFARCQEAAREKGYLRAIHALMQDDNFSGKISSRYGRPIRRYTLFAKPLGGEA